MGCFAGGFQREGIAVFHLEAEFFVGASSGAAEDVRARSGWIELSSSLAVFSSSQDLAKDGAR